MSLQNSASGNNAFSQTEYSDETFAKLKMDAKRISGKHFYDCVFSHCSFREAAFLGCKFNDCLFQDCDLGLARFDDSSFSDTRFERSTVVGVNWTVAAWSRFQSESPISFRECVIDLSVFMGLSLRKALFEKCSAKEVEFSDADLLSANFSGTDLSKSRFQRTNLSKANFVGATNYFIDLTTNKIEKAKFSLPEAMSLLYGLNIVLVE